MKTTDATTKRAVKVRILIFISISLLISNHSTECYSRVPSNSGERYLDAAALRAALRRAVQGKDLFQRD
jgi:hypothetical protein